MFEKADAHLDDREEKELSCAKNRAYTVDEIKTLLGVSKTTAFGLLRANIFPYAFINGRYEIPKISFDKWLEALQKDMDECHGCG